MFGLSPLSSGHPPRFQPRWVRPSTGSYPCFSLPKDSSPGFASAACDSKRHLKGSLSLRLVSKLNLAAHRDSLAHSTKGTPSHSKCAPTACRRTVSGTVSLPSRGAFHLSLTVLVRYRSQESVQPWRVVPPASDRVSRARPYSGTASCGELGAAYGALTLSRRPSHAVPLPSSFVTASRAGRPGAGGPATPHAATPAGLHVRGFGLARFRSPLLARSRLISLPPGT